MNKTDVKVLLSDTPGLQGTANTPTHTTVLTSLDESKKVVLDNVMNK